MANGEHIMYMDKIMNDSFKQHYKQMEEVQRTRGKTTLNASGFGAKNKNTDLQILPLEAPEIVGIIGIAFAVFLIALSL